jgi:hypothetical protein
MEMLLSLIGMKKGFSAVAATGLLSYTPARRCSKLELTEEKKAILVKYYFFFAKDYRGKSIGMSIKNCLV